MRKRRSVVTRDGRHVVVGTYYRRYDGHVVEVIALAEDVLTGNETVVFRSRHEDLLAVDEKLYICSADYFLSDVTLSSGKRVRYREVIAGTVSEHDAEWEAILNSSPMRQDA